MSTRVIEFDVHSDGAAVLALVAPALGEGKYIRQTSCPSKYGHIKLTIEPYEGPTTFRVEWQVPEDEIPDKFAAASIRGITERLSRPCTGGKWLASARVVIYGGSFHEVDSNEFSYIVAAVYALDDAIGRARGMLDAAEQGDAADKAGDEGGI